MKKLLLLQALIFCACVSFSQTVIQMKKEGGVSIIPCKVNGLSLSFIFDTGASDVTISLTEASFMLKNGFLNKQDIIGTSKYSDANGDISEGININLREIEIQGLKLYNVKAAIVKNMDAPLLLGQTAISKLGVVQLDLISNTLTILSKNSTKPILVSNNSNLNSCRDIDGNIYETVKIGSQLWMSEDLKVTHFQNGDPILEAKSNEDWTNAEKNKQPSWCYYEIISMNEKKYTILYNWYAVNDPRRLAPIGWHIPSNEDWKKITTILGGTEKAGAAMKTTKGWHINNGSNKSGFSGTPNGYRYHDGGYITFGFHATWWSSNENDDNPQRDAFYYYIYTEDNYFKSSYSTKGTGISVRCLKN